MDLGQVFSKNLFKLYFSFINFIKPNLLGSLKIIEKFFKIKKYMIMFFGRFLE